MHDNSALSAWQLAAIAIVAVVTLAGWLIAVFLADRQLRGHEQAAAGSPAGPAAAGPAAAGPGSRSPASPATTGEREPERPPAGRVAVVRGRMRCAIRPLDSV